MSNNESRERAAREYQAANPGTSYTRARRQVTDGRPRRPLVAVLGDGLDGGVVSVNLEWESFGGTGPHCLVVGDEVSDLLGVLATGLAAGQRDGDLELVLCAKPSTQLGVAHRRVDSDDLTSHVNELLESRFRLLQSLEAVDIEDARARGHRMSTTVVLIEDYAGVWRGSQALARWLRVGRSTGINVVVGTPVAPQTALTSNVDMSPARALDRVVRTALRGNDMVAGMAPTTIFKLGGGRGTLRTMGSWDPEGRMQRADVLVDFTFTAVSP